MQLTLNQSEQRNVIRQWSLQGVVVGDRSYSDAVLIGADHIQHPWPVSDLTALNAEAAQTLLALSPEIVIVGCGASTHFPPATFAAALLRHGVGCEAMSIGAACRTYNVLVWEERQALALLFPQSTNNHP